MTVLNRRVQKTVGGFWQGICLLVLLLWGDLGLAHAQKNLPQTRNDPSFRENAPPAVFPNSAIPPKYPEPKPQTHGLDLSKHDWPTARAYFKWLCENEAGEFIYRTVENVDSVFEMRRRAEYAADWRIYDRYYLEDPWGWPPSANGVDGIANPYNYVMPSDYGVSYKDPGQWRQKGDYFRYIAENGYSVLERVTTSLDRQRYGDAPIVRFTRVWPTHPEYDRDGKGQVRMFQLRKHLNAPLRSELPPAGLFEHSEALRSPDRKRFDDAQRAVGQIIPLVEAVHDIKSRYGYMWRGIERSPHDRELGIGGGEVLVFDLQTNEVLAVRRNFRLSGTFAGTRNVDWLAGQQCLDFGYGPLLHKKVLKPADPYKNLNIE